MEYNNKDFEALEKRVKLLEEMTIDKQIDNLIAMVKSATSKEIPQREKAKYRALAAKVSELYSLVSVYAERKN